MKKIKYEICGDPIPEGMEKYIQAKRVCERCFNKLRYEKKVGRRPMSQIWLDGVSR